MEALSSLWLEKIDFSDEDMYRHYVSYEFIQNNEVMSDGTVLFCPPKHFAFADPKLYVRAEGDTITVRAESYAKSVQIYDDEGDLLLSDNFFDMNAGKKAVKIIRGLVGNIHVRSVFDIR